MKKTYTIKNFAKRLALVLAVGLIAVNTWGSTINLTYTDVTTTSYSGSEATFTNVVQFGFVNLMRNGSNGTPTGWAKDQVLQVKGSGGTLYNKAAISTISNIRVYLVANTNTFTLTYGTTTACNAGSITRPTTATGSESITYTKYENKTTTTGQTTTANYYDFDLSSSKPTYFKITNGSSTIYIWKVVITYSSGYAVTYNNGGHGTAPSNTTASAVTLSAITGVTGYTCTGWKANVAVTNTSTSASISAGTLIPNGTGVTLSQATTFTAQWETTKYTVSFAVSPAGYGTVSQASVTNVPHGTVPSSSTNTVTVNGTTVTATPHAQDADYNYAFSSWSNVPASVTGAVTITANFTRTTRPLTNYRTTCCTKYDITLANSGSVTGGTFEADPASACEGTSISITATPGNGYAFSSWTIDKEGGGTVSPAASSATTSFTMPSDNVTVTAAFSCVAPAFTVHPASKTDYLTTDSPTPLGYTASAAGASLTQQWQVSDDNSNWSNIGGATSTTYSPVISSAGTKYYRVVVTNGTCGTSANSNVATITSVAPSVCLTPTFSVDEGTYTSSQSVTLSCATPGATIHYTTDGTTPDGSSPTYNSAIAVASTTTIKAIAVKDGLVNSPVASATYTIQCATPTFSVAAGTYTSSQTVTISTTYGTSIYYTTNGSEPTTGSTLYNGAITVSTTQIVKAIAVKTGCTNSAVGSAAYTIQCATPTFSPAAGTYNANQSVTLSTTYGAKIYYTTDGTNPTTESTEYSGAISVTQTTTIKAIAWTSGCTSSAIASATYTMKCATPTFSVAAGTYTGNQSVEISCTTSDVTIHYTTDGSTPDGSSPTYSSAIAVNSTQTIKAIAMKSNWTTSDMATAAYTIKHNVTWKVNGETYSTGVVDGNSHVTHGSKISDMATAPADNTLSSCASKFMGWSCKNFGSTPKTTASGQYDDLFTTTGGSPYITQDTTFYAVFAEVAGANVNDTLWFENWKGHTGGTKPTAPNTGDGYEAKVYGSANLVYMWNNGSSTNTNVASDSYAGGSSPEVIIGKNYGSFKVKGLVSGGADSLILEYKQNGNYIAVTIDSAGYKIRDAGNDVTSVHYSTKGTTAWTIACGSTSTFVLEFKANTSNARLDDILIKVKTPSYSNYRTQCDANMVRVTYAANGGSTTCANGTHDKRTDYTVCATEPTRDYYTFAGWLCSADSKTYAASATIPAAAIDADFTLTAQWTPVPYNITYELDGGTNNVGNPATYNVTTATITLQDPTKGHDRFDGWYDNGSFTGDAITSIPLGSHGNVTLYAKWAERHYIEFFKEGVSVGEIWRADDENMEDAVAGQGSVPSDPSAPTACSSKVFVGWSESTINDETDDKPADLMKSAVGTVDEDKEFHAVWAIVTPTDPPATYAGTGVFEEITSMGDLETGTYYVLYGYDGESTHGALKNTGSGTAGEEAGTNMTVSTSSITNPSTDIVWKLGGTTDAYTLYNQSASKYIEITTDDSKGFALNASATSSFKVTVEDGHGFFFKTNKTGCTRGISIYTSTSFRCYALASAKNLRLFKLPTNTVTAYCTSCCATNVMLSQNSPSNGTIEFGKTKVGTCGDKEVSLTITPAAGYQLHSYEVATGSGKVATKSVSPDIALDNNSSAAQNITLTFADEANGAYDVTASFTLMTVTSWTWTMHDGGGAIPDPLNLYVGQSARLDVAYTPSGVDATKKTYERDKDDAYINWVAGKQPTYSTISGKASTGENTTEVTFTHADGPTKTVNVKVLPLPLTHFVDLVHGKAFADVAATIEDNALSATKSTPTSDDWTTPNANTCETNHLHLVGWIRSDWPALVAYLNGTGDAPSTAAIAGAGNDDEGHAYFFAPGASINVQTFDGKTFYAVWAEIK